MHLPQQLHPLWGVNRIALVVLAVTATAVEFGFPDVPFVSTYTEHHGVT